MLFESLRRQSDPPSDLVGIIRQARRRWRLKIAVRGVAVLAALALALFLAAAYVLEWMRFTPASIMTLRVASALGLAAAAVYFLVRPLMRRVTDEQVAMYLEEHEPSLQATLVSAVDASRQGQGPVSALLVQRLVEQAVERCATADAARRVEREPLRRSIAGLAAVALVAIAVFLLGPAFIRHAASALLLVSRSVEAAAPYRIQVTPGNATVPRGADQSISAVLDGFAADEATLMVRRPAGGTFESLPLVRGEEGRHEGMIFDLSEQMEYFVEAGGVRSPVFTLKVVDLPYVQRLELEFRFPAYTGLPPQTVEEGGDIAVLRGTEVRMRVVPTMKTPGGRVLLHDKETIALAAGAEGVLTGGFTADRDGFYRIELDAPTGEHVAATPQYTIDVLTDQAPTVSFTRPGRDTTASAIEEVFVEASAEDDYGVRNLELVYAVNGGPEKRITLFGGRARLPEVTASHTFYLEELNVQPGDSVSYFARASDNDGVEGAKQATSDLYFLRIRPFKKDFRPAMSMGGGGGAGQPVDALSEQQRQIVAATFNLQRDRATYSREKLREHTTVVALSQARLREQVEGLVARMNSRLVEPDPAFKKIAELLPQAVAEMQQAEAKLAAASPDGALPPEHRALGFLQKAEEEYETQISTSENAGGGGGGSSAMAQELADLFELELDRMANQYETADRALQQDSDQQLDELLEKLKELARRQEQEAERQKRRAAAGQSGGGAGGGAQQRALADEAEEAARRLERLAREQNRADLQESARRMQDAADAMRRAAASGDAGAAAQATAALQRLRDIERRLQTTRSARAERDVKDALRQAEELAREQKAIADGVKGMSPGGEARREEGRQLGERKDALESKLSALEKHLDRSAADAGSEEREASRKLSEAASAIRDERLRDKIRYSKWMVTRGSSPEQAEAMEQDIASGFDKLTTKLAEAASALGQSTPDPTADALEKARRLARGMESLQERMREKAAQGAEGSQGSEGSEGSKGSEGSGSKGAEGAGGAEGSKGAGGAEGAPGAEGAQGSDGSGGSRGAAGRGDTRGEWAGGGGWGDRRPGEFSRDDVRQFRNEIRRWRGEGQELRRLLQEGNLDPKELDAILRGLRALDDDRVYRDVAELQRLQTMVTEGLKRFEFALRRRAAADGNETVLSGADEVPEEFRTLVEQYYRALAKTRR